MFEQTSVTGMPTATIYHLNMAYQTCSSRAKPAHGRLDHSLFPLLQFAEKDVGFCGDLGEPGVGEWQVIPIIDRGALAGQR